MDVRFKSNVDKDGFLIKCYYFTVVPDAVYG